MRNTGLLQHKNSRFLIPFAILPTLILQHLQKECNVPNAELRKTNVPKAARKRTCIAQYAGLQ
jgi:hypothetical protein